MNDWTKKNLVDILADQSPKKDRDPVKEQTNLIQVNARAIIVAIIGLDLVNAVVMERRLERSGVPVIQGCSMIKLPRHTALKLHHIVQVEGVKDDREQGWMAVEIMLG